MCIQTFTNVAKDDFEYFSNAHVPPIKAKMVQLFLKLFVMIVILKLLGSMDAEIGRVTSEFIKN